MTKALQNLCSSLLILSLCAVTAMAQWHTDVCNDQINVGVNHDCAIDLTVDAFLEGDLANETDVQNGLYTYEVYNHTGTIVVGDQNGPTIGGDDLAGYVNSLLFFKIYYDGVITCAGTLLLEDKLDPVVDCTTCPQINGNNVSDYNPDCIRNCFQEELIKLKYDDRLTDRIIESDIEDFIENYVTDNCDNWDIHLSGYYDHWTDFGPCVGSRLIRTWNISFYDYNNQVSTVSCTREYFFQPFDLDHVKEYPIKVSGSIDEIEPIADCLILPIELVSIPCSHDISPAGIAAYFDNPDTKDRDSDNDNIDPDELDIDLIVENNEGIPFAYPHYYAEGVGTTGLHAQAIDNELCNIVTGYTDSALDACQPGCLGNRKVLRSWTILDWCNGSFIHYDQIIKAVDNQGPHIEIPEITASVDPWDCKATVHLPHPEHIFDNCDNFYAYTIGSTGGYEVIGDEHSGYRVKNVPLGEHTIEYKSEDCCGNVGRTYVKLYVVDNTPPVAISKEYVVVSLTNVGNPIDEYQGTAKVYAWDLDNGSYDGCSDVNLAVRRSSVCRNADAYWGDYVTFCCEDLEGVSTREIDVELRITDDQGNENLVWTTVRLEDKSNTYPTTPPHMILTCDMDLGDLDLTGGIPRYFGACGEGVVACDTAEVIANTVPRELRLSDNVVINGVPIEAPAYDVNCGSGALRRSFRDCGGGTQWLVIYPIDPFDNTAIVWPQDKVIDCNNYNNGEPEWPETTCNLVGVSVESDTFHFQGNSCMKILNHWTIIDWCLYNPAISNSPGLYTHTQVVKLIDTLDPIVEAEDSLCYAVLDDCFSRDVVLKAKGSDNGDCGSEWLDWELSIDLNADWTEDYFYSSYFSRYLSNGEINIYHLPHTGDNEELTATLPNGIPASQKWHRAIWRAYDGCGNTTDHMIYFQIADKKAPTPYCLNLSTAVMENGEVELWAIDLDKGSFDNCSGSDNLIFTFTDVAPPVRKDDEYDSNADLQWYNGTFWYFNSEEVDPATGAGEYEDRDDYGDEVHLWNPNLRSSGKIFTADDADNDGMVNVPVYVWDENGNVDFCLVSLRLIDNGGGGMAMVAGNISTEFGEAIENISTRIEGEFNYKYEDITDFAGDYSFPNTPMFSEYAISGVKNDDYMNGISTLDIILIQRHILGLEYLDSPYKMIAADVNNDKAVSVIDLLQLRKLILGLYSELPDNGSWKMVKADNQLTTQNPWQYEESITIQELLQDRMDEDFIGVKIGDLNHSVVLAAAKTTSIEGRSSQTLDLLYEDAFVQTGEIAELELRLNAQVLGMQWALDLGPLELVALEGDGITVDNYSLINDGILLFSHNEIANEISIKLTVRGKSGCYLSDVLELRSDVLQSEAYNAEFEILPLQLAQVGQSEEVVLFQNTPNPFNDITKIDFYIPNSGHVEINLTDVAGKKLKVIRAFYEKGYHSVEVRKEDLSVPGIIMYTLTANGMHQTRSMLLLP